MKRRIISLKPWIFWLIYGGVIAVCVLLDQLSKHFIGLAANNVEGWTHPIFPHIDWLYLHWTLNDGATGGIFRNLEWRNTLFFVMTLVGLPIFAYLLWRSRTRSVWGQIAFAFMIGGTLGNAIDRLFLVEQGGEFFSGAVRDFIHVSWFFGIFNIADSFLVVGVFMALFAIVVFDPDSLAASIISENKAKQSQLAVQEQCKTDVKDSSAKTDIQKTDEKASLSEQNDEDD